MHSYCSWRCIYEKVVLYSLLTESYYEIDSSVDYDFIEGECYGRILFRQ